MARQIAPLEVNSFVQGLVTEASPLTFPENASLDEDNFELLRDGSRRRRLGMDYEEGYQVVNTGQASPVGGEIALTTFNWENAGGDSNKELLVVQAGTNIRVFDLDINPLSTGQVYSTNISGADPTQVFSFASVDGTLVCTTGEASVVEITYNGGTFSRRNRRIKIRDFFGVEDTYLQTETFTEISRDEEYGKFTVDLVSGSWTYTPDASAILLLLLGVSVTGKI